MWKLALWGGLGFAAFKLLSSTKSESPVRVTWKDASGVAKSRDFDKSSVASDFAKALAAAGAADIQVVKMAA
jgi:hypothetical protein